MNTINASVGFSGFQLHIGYSSHTIPPLVPECLVNPDSDFQAATDCIKKIELDTAGTADNMLTAKVSQAYHTNKHCFTEPSFSVGD